jgi:FKBP-type peptidyl-prolyl cis-trans isomerase
VRAAWGAMVKMGGLVGLALVINSCQKPSGRAERVEVRDQVIGTGAAVAAGRTVVMHYRGQLVDGKPFDSSYQRGKPVEFVLGQKMVIAGWEQGVQGMRAGGRRRVVVPPGLAYGPAGHGPTVPANATLIFDLELVQVR